MAAMLGRANPGHRRKCRYTSRGCRCYLFPGQHGRIAAVQRRRQQRYRENRALRAAAALLPDPED